MRFISRVTVFAAIALALTAIGSAKSMAEDGYELAYIPPEIGGSPTIYRINVASGQVSSLGATAFSTVTDPQPIPGGKYRLYSTQTPDNKSYWLYRLETQTGRTWFYSNNSWTEVTQGN